MNIEIKEVKTKKDLKKYITFPFKLHKSDPLWTPPILADEYKYYNPEKNKNLKQNPYILLLAYKNKKLSGRIMGLINERANKLRNESLVRWTFLAAVDDVNVIRALLTYVENWGQNLGMTTIVGPRGFTDQEPQGAIVEGFDERAAISTHYNRPYLVEHLNTLGYVKDVDWVSYKMDIPEEIPSSYQNIIGRTLKNYNLKCVDFNSREELRPYVKPVFNLLNETYKDLYGFAPMSDDEMNNLAKKYIPILDPHFVSVIEANGEPIAFAVAMPDLTKGLRRANGRLFPFGLFHIIRASKKTKILQLLLVGIKKEYRRKGLFSLFAINMKKRTAEAGMKWIDSHLQLETNFGVRKWMDRLNAKVYRRYRAFKKELRAE